MLLAIDSGNTNIVFALFDHDGTLRGEWRGTSKAERTADEMGVWLWQLMAMENIDRQQVSAAIIASVVPAMSFNLKTLCRRYFSCEPVIIGEPGVDLGLDIRVDHPAEVGADRLVNAIAAHQSYGGPLIVIDFGTATTFDVIDGDGAYRGGAIAPGVNLSVEALHMAAAKLPRVGVGRPERVIGVNTIEAMRSGVFWGYVGMIEGLIARIKKEFGAEMKVIATGGLASLFDEATAVIEQADVDLTLRGLWTVYTRNQGQAT